MLNREHEHPRLLLVSALSLLVLLSAIVLVYQGDTACQTYELSPEHEHSEARGEHVPQAVDLFIEHADLCYRQVAVWEQV